MKQIIFIVAYTSPCEVAQYLYGGLAQNLHRSSDRKYQTCFYTSYNVIVKLPGKYNPRLRQNRCLLPMDGRS